MPAGQANTSIDQGSTDWVKTIFSVWHVMPTIMHDKHLIASLDMLPPLYIAWLSFVHSLCQKLLIPKSFEFSGASYLPFNWVAQRETAEARLQLFERAPYPTDSALKTVVRHQTSAIFTVSSNIILERSSM